MTNISSTGGSVFRMLCRVLGGQDQTALRECVTTALLPQLFNMAHSQGLPSALAVRCNEQDIDTLAFGEESAGLLKQALMDNTPRNMEISAQRTFKDLRLKGKSALQTGLIKKVRYPLG